MRGGAKAPTMVDVARTAGVSRAAVSKVVRDAYGVSPEMRQRVESAIDSLGYRPSVAARAIRGSSFTIGFELHELENPALSRILRGAAEGIAGTGFQLVVAPATGANRHEAIESLVSLGVDGLVVVAPQTKTEWLEHISERIPTVVLSRHDDSCGYDTMTGDDDAGIRLAMRHLFGLGHDRIAHLTRSADITAPGLPTAMEVRLEGYRRIMHATERSKYMRVVRTGLGHRDGFDVTRRMLLKDDRPTALVAMNDDLALSAIQAREELGLSPAHFSIVGFDNIPISAHPAISLSTVDQFGDELGRRAVGLLMERMAGRTEPKHESTSPRLRARLSTAPLLRE